MLKLMFRLESHYSSGWVGGQVLSVPGEKLKVILVFSLGIGRAEQQCHLILVLLFKPMGQISDLQLTSFWYILVGALVLLVVVTGVKQR